MTDITLLGFDDEAVEWDGQYELVQCKRALSPSVMYPVRYSLNPYGGCEHGCVYCFAPAYTHSDPSRWRVVRVKTNVVDRLAKEIDSTEGMIGLGTVTDAYQAAEGKFMLSRMCLDIIRRKRRGVFITTKSPLVLRDLEILKDMESIVAVSITNPDPRICKMTEPGAPSTEERLRTVRELVDSGVDACVFIAPVMSSLEGKESELADMIADTGVRKVFIDPYRTRNTDVERLRRMGIGPSDRAVAAVRRACADAGLELISGEP
jgi:DNA repair photolyase